MFRRVLLCVLMASAIVFVGCFSNKKVSNPIANVNSKQPDKVLYDRAMDAMKHNKFDVARLSLQTLINTYPDSEYVARAKLAIGDSWYAEGGSAAMAQAESEYKDFITFFPNMTEASEAQMKIANIHYSEMEKPDRDFTHAKRAEEEYRQLIMQFPDSPLVPEAKKKLLSVQEVLAEREYMIAHFYYLRESWPAAIARFKSLTDTYPLYSGADEALFELGGAYEKETDLLRRSKLAEAAKGPLIKTYTDNAVAAYDRILTRYPEEDRAVDARKRLEALGKPIPKATPEAIAQNKKEIESRSSLSTFGKVMENFKKGPDVSEAVKVGEPTLVDPKQASAPELVRAATASVVSALTAATTGTAQPGTGTAPPPENAPTPRSDAAAAPGDTAGTGTSSVTSVNSAVEVVKSPPAGSTESTGISELGNDLTPPANNAAPGAAPPLPPTQVNDAPKAAVGDPAPASANANAAPATTADPTTESSSKKKKKHHFPF
ncbi:MAG TPA: outer membrane protein assembly factor BamD [Terriglobales bacterium]